MKKIIVTIGLILSVIGLHAQTLENYLQAARKFSPLVIDGKNQSKANQLEAQRLKAQYSKAQVGVIGNYMFAPILSRDNGTKVDWNSGGAKEYYGYDLAVTNGGTFQGLLQVTQPVFNTRRSQDYSEQALIVGQIGDNNARLAIHDLEKAVSDQYVLCLLDKQNWLFTDSLIQLISEQEAILRKLTENGLMKQSDQTLLTIELQNQRNAKVNFYTTYRRDLLELNALCGISDTTFVMLPDVEIMMNTDTTLSRFMNKYRLDSLNLVAQRKVFETKYMPLVNAFANGGLNANYAPTIPNRFGVSAGVTLTWNLFDGHQRSINEQKTDVLLQTVSSYKSFIASQTSVRKIRTLNEIRGLDQRADIIRTQLTEYNSLMAFYRKELVRGQLPVINYINVLKTQITAKRDYLLLQTNRLLLINFYNYWNW